MENPTWPSVPLKLPTTGLNRGLWQATELASVVANCYSNEPSTACQRTHIRGCFSSPGYAAPLDEGEKTIFLLTKKSNRHRNISLCNFKRHCGFSRHQNRRKVPVQRIESEQNDSTDQRLQGHPSRRGRNMAAD